MSDSHVTLAAMYDTITAIPEVKRTPAEFTDAMLTLDDLLTQGRLPLDDQAVQGVLAAADWLAGETSYAPTTGEKIPPVGNVRREADKAGDIRLGLEPDSPKNGPGYVEAVEDFLLWVVGAGPLPHWLRATRG